MHHKRYRKLLYVPKYGDRSDHAIRVRIGLSAFTAVLCCIVLCSTTFAWFTDRQSANVSTIEAARYALQISCGDTDLSTASANAPITYSCTATGAYTFTLTAEGTAEMGFCQITVTGGETYVTSAIANGQSITLTVYADEDTEISFTPVWGRSDEVEKYGGEKILNLNSGSYLLGHVRDEQEAEPTEESTDAVGETTEPPQETAEDTTEASDDDPAEPETTAEEDTPEPTAETAQTNELE